MNTSLLGENQSFLLIILGLLLALTSDGKGLLSALNYNAKGCHVRWYPDVEGRDKAYLTSWEWRDGY